MATQTRKLNVMHVILNLEVGGAQEVVRTLVEYLASGECTPIVCTFKDGPLRCEIEKLGVKVEILPARRHSIVALPLFIADMIRIWRELTRLVREYDVQVVQTHLLTTLDFLTLLLRYTTSACIVLWTFHSARFELTAAQLRRHKWLLKPKRYVHRQLYRLAAHFVSGFIAVSEQVKISMLETIGPVQDKITVICNGVDIKRYSQSSDKTSTRHELGLDANAILITQVGTLKGVKGHRYMIEAMPAIISQYPAANVLFIGDGELGETLQAQAAAMNVDSHVHFLGNRRDVPALLAVSDVFVLPSLWEGLSMSLLEAMASGLPVVASEVSGTVQVVLPGEMGYLVPPGDVPALTEAIKQVLVNPERAQMMGDKGRRHVAANFSAQKQADEHLALYRRLLGCIG